MASSRKGYLETLERRANYLEKRAATIGGQAVKGGNHDLRERKALMWAIHRIEGEEPLRAAVRRWFAKHDHDCPDCKAVREALREP